MMTAGGATRQTQCECGRLEVDDSIAIRLVQKCCESLASDAILAARLSAACQTGREGRGEFIDYVFLIAVA